MASLCPAPGPSFYSSFSLSPSLYQDLRWKGSLHGQGHTLTSTCLMQLPTPAKPLGPRPHPWTSREQPLTIFGGYNSASLSPWGPCGPPHTGTAQPTGSHVPPPFPRSPVLSQLSPSRILPTGGHLSLPNARSLGSPCCRSVEVAPKRQLAGGPLVLPAVTGWPHCLCSTSKVMKRKGQITSPTNESSVCSRQKPW